MSEIVYAVHTRACTYLLDDEGICRWVLSRSGARSDDRCVGAQFVAALDLHSKGGLVGELRLGASALFIRSEDGRFVLIRTKPIEHVEIRGPDGSSPDSGAPEADPVVLPDRLAVAAVFNAPVHAAIPEPPSAARVILRDPRSEAPPPPSEPPPPRAENTQRLITEPFPAPPGVVHQTQPPPRMPAPAPLPPPTETTRSRSFPKPPPRVSPRLPPADDPTSTQPLPGLPGPGPAVPTGPVPAWPPMLAPPPPQAEMLPLAPARAPLHSAEELDAADLEEVGDEDQIYSMEVTLTMPLWPGAANLPMPRR